MIINLSTSPPSSSCSLGRSINAKLPASEFSLKPRTHLPKSTLTPYPFSSSHCSFDSKNGFSCGRFERPGGRGLDFRPQAVPGLDFSSFESVLQAAGVLAAIILVHETGHFLAAYLQGIHVSKFAIGFGPILAKFNAKDVECSIRAFPLGGFVGFPDNDPESDIPADDENLLKNRPVLDRVLVVSAGVIANIVFAYIIVFVQVLSVGFPVQEAFPGVLVPEVRAFSAASRDGLLPGDIILSVDGAQLPKEGPAAVSELVDVIKKSARRNVMLRIERSDQNFEVGVTPDESFDGTGKIGVQLSPNVKTSKVMPKNLFEAGNYAWKEFSGLSYNVLDSLRQILMNFSQSTSKVAGPVAIIAVGAEVARSNVEGLYQFAAVLNLNLAVINLLPLPALDGGTLALILIEAARGGRKLPLEVEQRIMSSGIMFVITLGIFLIIRDTLNLDFIKDML